MSRRRKESLPPRGVIRSIIIAGWWRASSRTSSVPTRSRAATAAGGMICGAATGSDPCRSQTPSKWCSGGGGGLPGGYLDRSSRVRSRSAGADQTSDTPAAARRDRCTVEARPLSGTRLWRLTMIGRERGRAVTFARTGVACLRCCCVQAWDSGGCILGSVAAKPKRKGPGITKGEVADEVTK
jgi:hypothetical protein